MSERADLRLPCEHERYDEHEWGGPPVDPRWESFPDLVNYCPGGRTLTPAEALSVLLPDVDWEALREAAATHERVMMYGAADYLTQRSPIWLAARRLLAVYDGKDTQ